MSDVSSDKVGRYYVVSRGNNFAIADSQSPCHKKLGIFRTKEDAEKLAEEINSTWEAFNKREGRDNGR